MLLRKAMGAVLLAVALALPAAALAFDESKYPDMQGQWSRPRGVGIQWDPSKPPGRGQQPPLTPEYQAIWEASRPMAARAMIRSTAATRRACRG